MDQASELSAALVGRYEVVRPIGAGGMATVYLARDLRHHRDVALKVFRREIARVLGSDRFLREIHFAAQLQHPNIVSLIDSGEAGELLFYLMPFVDGLTLRERIERGPLPIADAVKITSAVVDALGYAHRKGILHRDIKPENILLADGHVLVTDFGIGRALGTAAGRLTETGIVLGTPTYMAPEQVLGDPTIDARADLYAVGVVLYEMLTGEAPFQGETVEAILVRRFTDPVPPLSSRRSDAPEWLAQLVSQLVARDACDRPGSAAEVIAALEAGTATGTAISAAEVAVAVLPFANLSADPDNDFFADGLASELSSDLSRLSALRVVARASTQRLKGTSLPPSAIARELRVRYLVTGTVRRAASAVRITVELIDAADGHSLWSDKYSGDLADVFAVQERISGQVVAALRIKLTPREALAFARRPLVDPRVYDSYLRARHEMWRLSPDGLDRAEALLSEALTVAPDEPVLLVGLAEAHLYRHHFGIDPSPGRLGRAEEFAGRALWAAPDDPATLLVTGLLDFKRGRMQAAVDHLEATLRADPNNADALLWLAVTCCISGRGDDARSIAARLRAVDPLTPTSTAVGAWIDFYNGEIARCIPGYDEWSARDKNSPFARWCWAVIRAAGGYRDECRRALTELIADHPGHLLSEHGRFFLAALAGQAADALAVFTPQFAAAARENDFLPMHVASGFALIGDKDRALEWLELSAARGCSAHRLLVTGLPYFGELSPDVRFQTLVKRMVEASRRLRITAR